MSSKIPFSWKRGSKGNGSRILAREDPEVSLKHRVWFLAVLRLLHQCRQIIKITKLQLQIALHSALCDASKQSGTCWCTVSQCRTPCVAMASCRTLATSVRMAVSRPCNAATLAGSIRVNQLAKITNVCAMLPTVPPSAIAPFDQIWTYCIWTSSSSCFLSASPQAQGSLRWAQLAWPNQAKKQVNLQIIHNNSSRPQGWPAGLHLWYAHLPACPKRRFQPGAGRSSQVDSAKNEGRWGML